MQDIVLHGLKRSGNHVLIEWLTRHRRLFHVNDIANVNRQIAEPGYYDFPLSSAAIRRRRRWRRLFRHGPWPITWLYSIEDQPIDREIVDIQRTALNIVLVRDFENLFASRIRQATARPFPAYSGSHDAVMKRALDLWVQHVTAALARERLTKGWIGVSYDLFVGHKAYRAHLAHELGFSRVAPLPEKRTRQGGGSSFDGHSDPGAGRGLHRRKDLLNEEEAALLEEIRHHPGVAEADRLLTAFRGRWQGR